MLLLFSVFFSASETGMMSLNRYRLKHLARKGSQSAKLTAKLIERPDQLLGVILIGNTFANILASAVTSILAAHYFGDLGILLSTIALALVILIFGETAPKTLAALHPERVAFLVAWPLKYLLKILYPLVWFVNVIANGVLRLFRIHVNSHRSEALSLDELRTIVHESSNKISSNYKKMLLRILDLEQVTVDDVMVPRSEIYGIDLHDEWSVILDQLLNCPHAHVPLYRGSIDHVAGMLNLRKILIFLQKHNIDKESLMTVAEKVYFVPKGAILNRQLLNFQHEQQAAGLVVDEYGDIQGLITLQDVVQEVVGEFAQDVNVLDDMIQPQADGSYIVDGRINMRDLNRSMHWDLPLEGPKTLSGLIVEYVEMIPRVGLGLRIGGYPMEVLKVRGNAVRWVKIMPELKRPS
jgi:Mg2+/Co2+ transporter CorB